MPLRLITFGDSTLDSARYSRVAAPELLARSLGAELVHCARDGHVAKQVLQSQLPAGPGASAGAETLAVVAVGGNDLLYALSVPADEDSARYFGRTLRAILGRVREKVRPDVLLVATVYNPGGDDLRKVMNAWGGEPRALELLGRFNAEIVAAAQEHGACVVDLHAAFTPEHVADGAEPWITARVEPSEAGARAIAGLCEEAWRRLRPGAFPSGHSSAG